jgi:hypothetical protein
VCRRVWLSSAQSSRQRVDSVTNQLANPQS